jgi:hypothetical protein
METIFPNSLDKLKKEISNKQGPIPLIINNKDILD